MPPGYKIVDDRTVRGPDGREHDVLDAITALEWREQLCPLMRHEYTRWGQGPEWAWNVISEMLLVRSGRSFAAYFRGYTERKSLLGCPRWPALLARQPRDRPRPAGRRLLAPGR